MKGTVHKTDNEWIVVYAEYEQLPLYPDDAKRYQNEYDYYGAIGFKGEQVEFEIVNIVSNKNTLSDDDNVLMGIYAKLIKSDHISDISKMVDVPKQVFTLEQIMEAMLQISEYYADNLGKDVDGHKKALEIIQSLKQPKND